MKLKSQVVVVQFVIYFLIGFLIFTMMLNFLYYSETFLRKDLSYKYEKFIANLISSSAIFLIKNCEACELETTVSLKNITKRTFLITIDNLSNLKVENQVDLTEYSTSFNFLNYSYIFRLENYILYYYPA